MRNRYLRWLTILAAIGLGTVAFAYWSYASVTDQYIDAAFGDRIAHHRSLAGTPALRKALQARWHNVDWRTAEYQLARSAVGPQFAQMWRRQLLELAIAKRIHQRLSEDQVLSLYAQTVYLGGTEDAPIFGID